MNNYIILGIICIFLALSCIVKLNVIAMLRRRLKDAAKYMETRQMAVYTLSDDRYNLMTLLIISNLDMLKKPYPVYKDNTQILPLDKVVFRKGKKELEGFVIPNLTKRCQVNGNEPFLVNTGNRIFKLKDLEIISKEHYEEYRNQILDL